MKFRKSVLLLICFTLLFSGCNREDFFKESLKPVSSDEFSNFAAYAEPDCFKGIASYVPLIDDFIKENAYIYENGKYSYAVMKISDMGKYLFLLYRSDNNYLISSIFSDKFYTSDDFVNIKVGTPLSELIENFNTSEDLTENNIHTICIYLTDGGYYIINLNESDNIEKIEKFKDEYHFMDLLKKSKDFDIEKLYN